jgi:hypothetical protein
MELTDTYLVILSAAAQREDGGLQLPPDLEHAAAEKLVAMLAGAGLIEEIEAAGALPVWHRVDDAAFALRITAKGLIAIAVDDEAESGIANPGGSQAPSTVGPAPKAKKKGPSKKTAKGSKANPKLSKAKRVTSLGKNSKSRASAPPRGGSKIDQVRGLLMRKRGATIREMMELTTWLPHTTRAVLTGLRKRGFEIRREALKDKPTVYRIAGGEATSAKAVGQMA